MAEIGRVKQQIGRWGEELAARYLSERGYRVVAKNVRTSYGEIDLIARMDEVTVFVEVKTRTTLRYGLPEESITAKKLAHMHAAAQAYIQSHPEVGGEWRIDVISIYRGPTGEPEILHFENALS
jgi:putative endonuclease